MGRSFLPRFEETPIFYSIWYGWKQYKRYLGFLRDELPRSSLQEQPELSEGTSFPAVAAAFPRLFPVFLHVVLRSVNGITRCLCWPPSSSAPRAHPPAARIPGDLLPSGSQTRRQPGQGARFILQNSVFLLFLSSREAPRH